MENIFVLLIGILSGILGSILGLGGGTFTIPILILALNFNIHAAISLSLISIIATSLLTTAINIRHNTINLPLGILLTLTAVIGSTIGGRLGLVSSEKILGIIFSSCLLISATFIYIKRYPNLIYSPKNYFNNSYLDNNLLIEYTPKRLGWGMLISSFGGFLGGAAGLGGGGILVPVMKIINKLPMKSATATSVFIMGFSSIPPTLLYYSKGILVPRFAIFIIVGAFIGAFLGNKIVKKINDKFLAKIFSVILVIIAIYMFYKVLSK